MHFGCKYKAIVKEEGYMSGGAGYVLSRMAVKRFVEEGLGGNTTYCKRGKVFIHSEGAFGFDSIQKAMRNN